MRLHAPFIALAVLALAACGEEQTAQAPETKTTETKTAQAPSAPPPAAQRGSPPTTAGSGAADAPSKAVDVGSKPGGSQTAALPKAAGMQSYQGRPYAAGPMSLQLNADQTFVMNEVDGNRKVEGRYAFQDGIVIFSDPKGDVGPAKFPMSCRFEPVGSEFRLVDATGSCDRFKGLTFKPAAG